MLILPSESKYRLLMPMPRTAWRTPSQAQSKDIFGNENRTLFCATARTHDGAIKWRGWFDDREDFDAFAFAIMRAKYCGDLVPQEIWRLPDQGWFPGYIDLIYDFATQVFLVSGSSYTSPSDWNNSSNIIETIGGGGSGAASRGVIEHDTGGGGGAWNSISNFTFASPGTTTAAYAVGTGGIAKTAANDTDTSIGSGGGNTAFNGTTLATCSVGSDGASGGPRAAGSRTGGAGGIGSTGVGTSSHDGGNGGDLTGASGSGASGGGGAAGSTGNGVQGVSSSSTGANVSTAGGNADNGGSGAGTGGAAATDGNAGTEWDGSHGSGGGGGGNGQVVTAVGGSGGLYGAGGGGANTSTGGGLTKSGAGKQGIVVLTYTPSSGGSASTIFTLAFLH